MAYMVIKAIGPKSPTRSQRKKLNAMILVYNMKAVTKFLKNFVLDGCLLSSTLWGKMALRRFRFVEQVLSANLPICNTYTQLMAHGTN